MIVDIRELFSVYGVQYKHEISLFQVMVAALKFFLGSDPEEEKKSDDSDSDVSLDPLRLYY